MENKDKQKKELEGLIKELTEDAVKTQTSEMRDELAAQKEANEKLVKDNKEFKSAMDALQGKQIKLEQNTGSNLYTFKGYNPNMTSNFKAVVDKDMRDEVMKDMVLAIRNKAAYTSANTGAYAIPVEYTNALLGLAELKSTALAKATVYTFGTNSIKMPAKGTRATVDAQAFGTTNADAATTLAQLAFTIDKRVGSYQTINNDVLQDEMFDVAAYVESLIAEAIGQNFDDEMFNGTEFTTSISDVTASVTASGTVATAAAITYKNLVDMAFAVELERGVSPEWFLPRGAMKDIVALVSSATGTPIFNPVPISGGPGGSLLGYPINIVPAIDNTPDDGAIRMAFGDPKEYIIALNGGMRMDANPYVLMKEAQTQFIGYMRADGNYTNAGAWTNMKRTDA